jgi:hypothetical protein
MGNDFQYQDSKYHLVFTEIDDGMFDIHDEGSHNGRHALYVSREYVDTVLNALEEKDEFTIDSVLRRSTDCTDGDIRRDNAGRLDRGDTRTIYEVIDGVGSFLNS